MPEPVPAHLFKPETDRSYLVYCPEHGGWHVGEWWTVDSPGHWALSLDISIRLPPVSHVLDVPPDAMDTSAIIQWAVLRQTSAGSA